MTKKIKRTFMTMTYEEQKATGLLPLADCIKGGVCPPSDLLGFDPFIKKIEEEFEE